MSDFIFDGPALLISEDGANLLARSSPIAFTAIGRYWVNNHAHVVQFEEMVTQRYVEHYLNHMSIEKWVRGAAQPKLTQHELNSIPIPLPHSVEERANVVDKLSQVEASVKRIQLAQDSKRECFDQLKTSILAKAFSGDL